MSTDNPVVITYAKRTPVGKFMGAFKDMPAPRLGSLLILDAVKSTGIRPEDVSEVIMGQVLTAGVGQAPARQAALYADLPQSVCATTINRVCGSGLKSVMLADQAIRCKDASVVIAGGQENMSLAPHILPKSRQGFKFGSYEMKDSMQWDGLWDPYHNVPMGNCAETCVKEYNFSREEQDAFALESYQRSRRATESGHFAKEVVPVEVQSRRETNTVSKDEEPFSVDLEKISKLRPAFDQEGSVTAGNASSLNDGAAAVMLMDMATAKEKGIKPLAKVIAHASHAQSPERFTTAPIKCIEKVLRKAKMSADQIDIYEINEAFAAVTMAAIKDLKLDPKKVNPYGGAVSIGHPIGASGTRVLVTLINGLIAQKKTYGLVTLCIGGGEASAMIVEII